MRFKIFKGLSPLFPPVYDADRLMCNAVGGRMHLFLMWLL